ncbi:dihydroxyacetone kinase subunit DhaL [Salisediminibacterium beveridgei]|uniref:phosphoenolpyruvate--glycerone phosphotransferase n=1 Tax=Salisediminibacterium beveridgei TaxID=632773 RepID=A0A1D7QS24_9BACI|nr:dihydroxyacetone kinase subunit DhaL [Salisediminibacterium beveridgei]AOM81816.1 Phosphoenolpyruvate-dihydroxyacetone phosphotransferase, ADP-binding subunit DhaL [Salisediminibacterium beveridgei]
MFTVENTIELFRNFATKVQTDKAWLSDLDTPIGDGDHGTNMARGLTEVTAKLDAGTYKDPGDVFKAAAMAMIGKTGGASGPLYGTAFMEMSKAVQANPDDITGALEAGLAGIQKRGKATAGEKTMVDVWVPVIESVKAGGLNAEHVDAYVEKTKPMKATKGRASYLGERSIGHLDPGSASSGLFFKALLEGGALS